MTVTQVIKQFKSAINQLEQLDSQDNVDLLIEDHDGYTGDILTCPSIKFDVESIDEMDHCLIILRYKKI